MQVPSRRGIASYLWCKNELGFMASSVKALIRDLKGVDTVFISYCFYAIALQPCNKGSSYPTKTCNSTHPQTAMSRYSMQHFQQQSCFPPGYALADKRFIPRTLSADLPHLIPLTCWASTSQTQQPVPKWVMQKSLDLSLGQLQAGGVRRGSSSTEAAAPGWRDPVQVPRAQPLPTLGSGIPGWFCVWANMSSQKWFSIISSSNLFTNWQIKDLFYSFSLCWVKSVSLFSKKLNYTKPLNSSNHFLLIKALTINASINTFENEKLSEHYFEI